MSKKIAEEKKLANAHNWKHLARWNGEGYYELRTEDTRDVPVRMFLTPRLLGDAEDILYRQTLPSLSRIFTLIGLSAVSLAIGFAVNQRHKARFAEEV